MEALRDRGVVAVVAAYNESKHIKGVLEALIHTPHVQRVIVVDDASSDNTFSIAQSVPGIEVVRNDINHGKAFSMNRGVRMSTEPILFFCDADLVGLTPHIVSLILKPVIEGKRDMFVGIRNNLSQKSFLPFALNSGERALVRGLWTSLPRFFMYRYRIEVGLNVAALFSPQGMSWQQFDYYQTLKESKYGFWRGFLLRMWMNFDVGVAYCYAFLFSLKKSIKRHG